MSLLRREKSHLRGCVALRETSTNRLLHIEDVGQICPAELVLRRARLAPRPLERLSEAHRMSVVLASSVPAGTNPVLLKETHERGAAWPSICPAEPSP